MREQRTSGAARRFAPAGSLATFVVFMTLPGCGSDGVTGNGSGAGRGPHGASGGTMGTAGSPLAAGGAAGTGVVSSGAGRGGASTGGSANATSAGSANGGATNTTNGGFSNGGTSNASNGGTSNASNGGTSNGGVNAGGRSGGRGGRGVSGGAGASNGGTPSGGAGAGAGSSGSAGAGGDIPVPDGYHLVWHDEFDVDGKPDSKNWKYETGFVRNEEDQWYQSDNASVSDGMLVIEGRKERVTNPNYTGSGDWKTSRQYAEYTSASLNSSGLQTFQYGRFEMRARIPTSAGMWPAWWTLGVNGEWPSNGEVDIMEYYSGKVLANVACGTSTRWEAKWDSATKSLSSLGTGWSSEFHVWRMDWDDQNIVLLLDDQTMNTTALSSMLNADGTSPFKQKAYLLVNLALGGNNGGSLSGTTFPVRYEVDYIRVFQKN